jgi:PAS domain S-box-containing protein
MNRPPYSWIDADEPDSDIFSDDITGEVSPDQIVFDYERAPLNSLYVSSLPQLSSTQPEEWFRQLFHLNPHPSWIYEVETLRIVEVNAAAIEQYGYARDEFLNLPLSELHSPDDVAALSQEAALVDANIRDAGVWNHRKKDGSLFQVAVSTRDFLLDGRAVRFCINCNATNQRATQAALGRLMAHDFSSEDDFFAACLQF